MCTPDALKSLGKQGQCVSMVDLDDKCLGKEVSSSEDHCAEFEGSWCCYGKSELCFFEFSVTIDPWTMLINQHHSHLLRLSETDESGAMMKPSPLQN